MTRIEREKKVIARMVAIYCRHKEGNQELCADCAELVEYALQRLKHCPHGNSKPTCRHCPIHCYSREMRERMRVVMRFSGPRMIIYTPLQAFIHLTRELLDKKR